MILKLEVLMKNNMLSSRLKVKSRSLNENVRL